MVTLCLLYTSPHRAVGLFTTDEAIIAEGVKYLAVLRYTYLFFAVTTIPVSYTHLSAYWNFVSCAFIFLENAALR